MPKGVPVTPRSRSLIFLAIIFACVASSLLSTALNTALPAIQGDFNISSTLSQWTVSGYSLAMGIVMPLTAFLIRRFSTRRLFLLGGILVIIGLAIDVVAPGFAVLLVGRVLQACGNGIIISMAQVIILTIYPPERRGQAMGWYGLALGAAPVVAPTLSGFMIDFLGWRSIFVLVLIVMIVAFIIAWIVLKNVLDTENEHFEFPSFVVSIFAFGGITLGVGNIANYGIESWATWLPLAIGIVAAVIFVIQQLRLQVPFLNIRIFKHKEFTVATISIMVLYFGLMGGGVLMPQYIQEILGLSAIISGLILLPGGLLNAVINPFAGGLYDRFGMRKLYIPSAILQVIAYLALFFVAKDWSPWISSIFYALAAIAIAFILMPLTTWGVSFVKEKEVADATALISSLRTIAGAIGAALLVGIAAMVAEGSADTQGDNASMFGFNVAFLVMAIISAAMLVMGIIFVKDKKRTDAEVLEDVATEGEGVVLEEAEDTEKSLEEAEVKVEKLEEEPTEKRAEKAERAVEKAEVAEEELEETAAAEEIVEEAAAVEEAKEEDETSDSDED